MNIAVLLGCFFAVATAASPPLLLNLPQTAPPPRPLPYPFNHTTSPQDDEITSDARSLLFNRKPWFPVGGEIHFARVPKAHWRESLLRMQAGGLDIASVYLFWIHHEEHKGQKNFVGRRDVRAFLQVAREVGMKVLLRTGPWDHGEVRNGGHPDWLLPLQKTKANPEGIILRSTDPRYLAYVESFFAAVGNELEGMWWADGGPIVFCQLENEESDWRYMLALREIAIRQGFKPVSFTRTGWPMPTPVPKPNFCGTTVNGTHTDPENCTAYPILPFFGGYPDVYWTNSMVPAQVPYQKDNAALEASYAFGNAQLPSQKMWGGFTDTPKLNVEIGGGMAADYSHRPHMTPDDMPSLHLVDVGSGVNSLGFYMYHGGLNPAPENDRTDDPSRTLQEGAWSAPGTQNGMPSVNYNYFSPLDDLGQPLPHFHTMRRTHLFLRDLAGEVVRASVSTAPIIKPNSSPDAPFDNATLRWQVRSSPPLNASGESQPGFLFVNNYQRLRNMTRHTGVRFEVRLPVSVSATTMTNASLVSIPSRLSDALVLEPGAFFVWPLFLELGRDEGSSVTLAWATAQVLCRVEGTRGSVTTTTLVLAESTGVSNPELALILAGPQANVTSVCAACARTEEAFGSVVDAKATVVRGLDLESWRTEPAAVIALGEARRVQIVVLPAKLADSVWRGHFAGEERVFVSDPTQGGVATLVMPRAEGVELRSPAARLDVAMMPPLASSSRALRLVVDGIADQPLIHPLATANITAPLFDTYSVDMPAKPAPKVIVRELRAAGPARDLVEIVSGHVREPNLTEWQDAAVWSVALEPPGFQPAPSTDVRLRLRYYGDAARFKRNETAVLHDNWFTGYHGHGEMEAGLSYLNAEHGGALFGEGVNLTLHVLPLKKKSLKESVFLRREFWPQFDKDGLAVGLDGVDVLQTFRARLVPPTEVSFEL